MRRGEDKHTKDRARARLDAFEEAIRDFLEYMRYERDASDNTLKAYANDLSSWRQFCDEAGSKLFPIEPALVMRYMTRLEAEGLSLGTRNRRAATLSSFSKFLMYDGIV